MGGIFERETKKNIYFLISTFFAYCRTMAVTLSEKTSKSYHLNVQYKSEQKQLHEQQSIYSKLCKIHYDIYKMNEV